jgi:hypothetical protein
MIQVAVQIVDNTQKVGAAYDKASRLGMDAAANVYEREVKKAHGDHYTSQDFRSTLNVRQSIRRTAPAKGAQGWMIDVGTKLPQPLYWELGHQNLFTRKFERRRIWVPTLIAQTQAIRDAFARVVARVMNNA